MTTINPYCPFPAFGGRSMPQMPPQPNQPNQPRPLYFLSRNNGLLVPLIPADELPFNVRLQGVQRVMQFEQTYGMQHVGTAPYTGLTFKLENDPTMMQRSNSHPPVATHVRSQTSTPVNPFKQYLAPDALARQALAQSAHNHAAAAGTTTPQRPVSAHETASNWRSNMPTPAPTPAPIFTPTSNPTDKTQSIIDAIVSSTSGAAEAARIGYVPRPTATPPSGYLPDQDKKKYCTYWIRTGECDYTQQGCLYLHEMPDRATLENIGFRTMPRWWAEKQSAVKLGGGERASVGPIVKSSEWLKKKAKRDVGSEDADDSASSGSESEASSSSSSREPTASKKETAVAVRKAATPERTEHMGIKEQPAKKHADKPTTSAARALAPTPVDIRKVSITGDLIDFAVPLLPTPPSSTPSLTPASSVVSSPRTGQSTPLTPPTPSFTEDIMSTKKSAITPTKVFVPKGESPDHHIAEAKKHAARQQHARRGAPVSSIGAAKPLERQIQEMQKAKHQQGLMASKHAPSTSASSVPEQGPKRSVKTGCRVRRPAPSAPVTIMKREVAVEKQG
ncbi:hypothetical protein LTR36_010920 [Oleoguttula mirabilis]|uniref:C3H1-type domain-containing protein n=1 Tax=Oleoguttula mirabilis TaxID=1507867 RepID=A0AAV9J3H7_9PEZI|nr:hypothetical protein LTR36_010920 [Oleoguttula mirabilis]